MGRILGGRRPGACGVTLLRIGLYVQQLWRYPVKSMAGEALERAEIALDGVAGDRLVAVRDARHILTARTKPLLLSLHATVGPGGEALVETLPWDDEGVRAMVRFAAGEDAELEAAPARRFDVLPLLVATDGALREFGRDGRRLRPNIVLGGVDGMDERGWEGKLLRIGDVEIRLDSLRERCIMTTFHPDTLEQDVDVLRDIRLRFGGKLALNAAVERPGVIALGDSAEVADG
jgi:uncharacterized protein YcbX